MSSSQWDMQLASLNTAKRRVNELCTWRKKKKGQTVLSALHISALSPFFFFLKGKCFTWAETLPTGPPPHTRHVYMLNVSEFTASVLLKAVGKLSRGWLISEMNSSFVDHVGAKPLFLRQHKLPLNRKPENTTVTVPKCLCMSAAMSWDKAVEFQNNSKCISVNVWRVALKCPAMRVRAMHWCFH